ncbi:MAG: DUF350 domain-containing protein [Acidobacteriota bacterium]|nr:DUF350 domain-containing protein [Acidobacteriota bacterium]
MDFSNYDFSRYVDVDAASYYVSFVSLAFLVEALILLWIGKLIRDLITPFDDNKELTTKDNKALATSYIGYLVGQGIIILGVLQGPSTDFVDDLIGVAIWSLVGMVLLNVAVWLNDKFLLTKFNSEKEIIEDRNVGTGAVQCGSYIGTAFLIRAVVSSEGSHDSLAADIFGTLLFFVVGQIGFILFSKIYQQVAKYDVHAEIEKDNVAAGVSFGMTLAAVGILMSKTIYRTPSLVAFAVWFVTGLALLIMTRFIVDKLILPGHKLDNEIAEDRNWGAALIEGGAAVIVAFMLNASFA